MVELGDVEGMADRLRTLLANDTMRQRMGQKARKWVLEEFSLEQLARRTEAIYLETLSNKRNKKATTHAH